MAGVGKRALQRLKVALCQLAVTENKDKNVQNAVTAIANAADKGARLIVLPECYNSPYGSGYFPTYAEPIPDGPTSTTVAAAARQHKVFVVAGSIPERDGEKLYNTCAVFDPEGEMVAKYRKMHLFKINTEKVKFDESETLTAGEGLATFNIDDCKIGVGICFDVRYPELAELYRDLGTSVLVYPGAFNMVTGPVHWQLAARSRAVDTQQYVMMCSPARDTQCGYVAYGHSLVSSPWGAILGEADESEITLDVELNLDEIDERRAQVPIIAGKRPDLIQSLAAVVAQQQRGEAPQQ